MRDKLVLLRLRQPLMDGTVVFIVIDDKDYGIGQPEDPFSAAGP